MPISGAYRMRRVLRNRLAPFRASSNMGYSSVSPASRCWPAPREFVLLSGDDAEGEVKNEKFIRNVARRRGCAGSGVSAPAGRGGAPGRSAGAAAQAGVGIGDAGGQGSAGGEEREPNIRERDPQHRPAGQGYIPGEQPELPEGPQRGRGHGGPDGGGQGQGNRRADGQ